MLGIIAEAYAILQGGAEVFLGVILGTLKMIDTFDRPGKAFASGTYVGAGTFAEAFENNPRRRLPKAGVYAAAGVGHARAEWSIFDAEAKGPNVSAGLRTSLASLGGKAFARAELASASVSAGTLKATVSLAADTGIRIGLTGMQAKVLGTGFSIGRKMVIFLFGNEFEFNLW